MRRITFPSVTCPELVVICVVLVVICIVLDVICVLSCYLCCPVVILLFYVLFVCKCVLPPGDNPTAINKCIISIISYLLTPWNRVLLEKLTSKLCS